MLLLLFSLFLLPNPQYKSSQFRNVTVSIV